MNSEFTLIAAIIYNKETAPHPKNRKKQNIFRKTTVKK